MVYGSPNTTTGGYGIRFYCGQNNPLPTVNASIWYWQVSPGMIADFKVYKYDYNVYGAGTYLAYAVQGGNGGSNNDSNLYPLSYANGEGRIGPQNTVSPSPTGAQAVSYLSGREWNTAVITYNNSTINTWTNNVNGVNVVQNSNPNQASWKANSGTHWGIGSWNINDSNCMNTFVRNLTLTYQ